jgi:CubicO group peptidase (beta-lactamase class C family)
MTANTRLVWLGTVIGLAAAAALAFGNAQSSAVAQQTPVDGIFAKWTSSTPGCAVGVSENARPSVSRAFGMADLEHPVRNAPDTIFEAGSVSKQFTAAAVLLLERDGKLSLDDPVRKYIPELPAYGSDGNEVESGDGAPLTVRHLLTHTSGLRDWGSLADLAGAPRTTRVYTHAHVLDILSRQHALNFPSGTKWSYSNSGYNLAAILVSRVSGQPFADFTRERIFKPLGMRDTSWRDDFTRIVPRRAIAYAREDGEYHQDMPFENVHGNGGLLTTVGDLLRWNENFVTPVVGDARFVEEQQTVGRFNDGRAHDYAFGLFMLRYRGLPEVNHTGATAGYRSVLLRYPRQHVSIAVLCNAGDASPLEYAHAIADSYLRDQLGPVEKPPAAQSPPKSNVHYDAAHLSAFAGRYHSEEIETDYVVAVEDQALVLKRRPATTSALEPIGPDSFYSAPLGTITFHRDGGGQVIDLGVREGRVWDLRFRRVS